MRMNIDAVEKQIWDALDMDDFDNSLRSNDFGSNVQFGTGHTVNSCNTCDNSLKACTSGEANCNPKRAIAVPGVTRLQATH